MANLKQTTNFSKYQEHYEFIQKKIDVRKQCLVIGFIKEICNSITPQMILSQCILYYAYYNLPRINNFLSNISFGPITNTDIKETMKAYKMCKLLTLPAAEQKALWTILAIGRKNNVPQLLTLLFSVYSRARIEYFIKYKDSLSFAKWMHRSQLIQNITNKYNNSIREDIKSALDIFQKRFTRPINLEINLIHKINDNILIYAEYIADAIKLIKIHKSPQQIDLWIIPKKIGPDVNNNTNNGDDNDNDNAEFDQFDDCSSDDDSDDSDIDKYNSDNLNNNDIGDIETTLSAASCIYITNKHNTQKEGFNATYRRFLQKINTLSYNRFCIIIDRNGINDIIYMYVPCIYNKIEHLIPELFIESSISDILPAFNNYPAITSKTALNNKMFLLSLHNEQHYEIRAWIYHKASMFRFQPNDLLNVFPLLFVNPPTQKEKQKLKKLIIDCKIRDVYLQQFYKIYSSSTK